MMREIEPTADHMQQGDRAAFLYDDHTVIDVRYTYSTKMLTIHVEKVVWDGVFRPNMEVQWNWSYQVSEDHMVYTTRVTLQTFYDVPSWKWVLDNLDSYLVRTVLAS